MILASSFSPNSYTKYQTLGLILYSPEVSPGCCNPILDISYTCGSLISSLVLSLCLQLLHCASINASLQANFLVGLLIISPSQPWVLILPLAMISGFHLLWKFILAPHTALPLVTLGKVLFLILLAPRTLSWLRHLWQVVQGVWPCQLNGN